MTPELTPDYLEWVGQHLNDRLREVEAGKDPTERDDFIETFLKIRTKSSNQTFFRLNRAQQEYSFRCSKQNVVLKARQVGITTYIAARFFVQTITQRGTMSMQVTQDRESAEDIFRIVRRFWENLPDDCAERASANFAQKCAAVGVSAFGQRILSGFGGRECGTRADDPESALLGGFAVGPKRRRGAGVVAVGSGAGRRHCAGVDAERSGGTFLRGVAAGGGYGIYATLFSLVV